MASLALGIAGAALAPAGYAAIGWTIGSTLGSLLFAEDRSVEGPRLDDLKVIDSTYGNPIPIVYGRDRISGNIIWAKDLEEVKIEEESGGKGGPSTTTTTYEYYATFAMGICEGEIIGVRRIWVDTKLVYKFTEDATVEELLASNAEIDGITVYTGSESQEADPLIQADKGIANTPAFRGLAYIVFDRLDVSDTGRVPNIEVEVIASGSLSTRGFISSSRFTYPVFGSGGRQRSRSLYNFNGGIAKTHIDAADQSLTADSELAMVTPEMIATIDYNGTLLDTLGPNTQGSGSSVSDNLIQSTDVLRRIEGYNVYRCASIGGDWVWINGRNQIGVTSNVGQLIGWGRVNDVRGLPRNTTFARQDLTQKLIDEGATGEWLIAAIGSVSSQQNNESFLYVFTAPSLSTGIFNVDKYYKFELSGNVLDITETGTVSGMSQTAIDEATGLNGQDDDAGLFAENEDFIWAARIPNGDSIKVTLGEKSGNSFAFSTIYSQSASSLYQTCSITASDEIAICYASPEDSFSDLYVISRSKVISLDGITLSDIVSDLCERSGLDASDIDVTDLDDTVQGYTVTKIMSGRKSIEPLMAGYYFDGAEYSNKINFTKRGQSSILTIPEDDLGAATFGGDNELYLQTRQQESELPSEVVVNYKDLNRDFQKGSQQSQRINTYIENVKTLDLPIAFTANEGKQRAEVIQYNLWTEREKFTLSLSPEYIDLNPTDVINFTAEGDTRQVRIANISYGSVIEIDCVSEDGAYVSDATAGDSESVDQTLGLVGPTNLRLLDIPLLRNQDNDTGIYEAVSGYYNGWSGARIYKSTDDVSYSEVDAIFSSSTQGYATTVLSDGNSTLVDYDNSVTIRLTSGSISSSTLSNVIKGSNYALLGSEIINFVNVTDNGDGTYTLDTLLRGRRGTDWATSSHETSERFVILNSSTLGRLEAVLNTARYFKGVSIGNFIVNADSQEFTNTGINLKPFSPVNIEGTRDGSNNLTITWLRRSRYIGGALQTLPLFEDSKEYKVQILSGPGGSVVRTLSPNPTTESDTYSASDQTTDGFTPGDPITVKIYQVSDTVGDGYGREATI